ncbi:hypothetical protein Rhal01_00202 [Rubritalea halochordaticola]|uniref:Calx-beta domain-containing protein n=1 Tax=Rubritalea halochordaticola TaxID=714537 RepID=A0ABP9UYZ8_9BACT
MDIHTFRMLLAVRPFWTTPPTTLSLTMATSKSATLACTLLSLSTIATYAATGDPLGAELRLAQGGTGNHDDYFMDYRSTTALTNGTVVVGFNSRDNSAASPQSPDGDDYGGYFRMYTKDGVVIGSAPISPYSDINASGTGRQRGPVVQALTGGGFAAVWQSSGGPGDTDDGDVYTRVYNASGVAISSTIRVNESDPSGVADEQREMAVVALSGGGYAVVWRDDNDNSGNTDDLYVRAFNANGTAKGASVQLGSNTLHGPLFQDFGDAVALDDGGFVVSWRTRTSGSSGTGTSADGTNSGYGAFYQVFNADGTAESAVLFPYNDINPNGTGGQNTPKLAALSGGFAITWHSTGGPGDVYNPGSTSNGGDTYTRVFNNAGVPNATGTVKVNDLQTSDEETPTAIVALAGGGYAVVWRDDDEVGGVNKDDYYVRAFTAAGAAQGASVQLGDANHDAKFQDFGSLIALSDGGYAACWRTRSEGSSGSGASVDGTNSGYASSFQVFNANGTARSTVTFPYFDINPNGTGGQSSMQLAPIAAGGFAAIWTSVGGPGDVAASGSTNPTTGGDVYTRLYNNDGTAASGTKQAHVAEPTGTNDDQAAVEVIEAQGSYAVVIRDDNDDTNNKDDYFIRFFESPELVVNTPPTLSLTGANPFYVECNIDSFTDPGATATDAEDDDSTLTVTSSGTVNTAVLGSYTITYNVSDSGNAAATPITRTVIVRDTTKPVITRTGAALIYVEQKVDSYTDQGATVTDACDSTVSVVTGGATVNPNVAGNYVITYNATDASSNVATQVTRTVTVRDTTPPTITRNGVATLTLEAGVDSYSEQGATATDIVDGSVSVTIGGDTVNTNVPGVYTVTYNAKDAANNSATQVTRVVTVQDTTQPVITIIGPSVLTLEATVDTYTEQGATATDNIDGSLPVTIGGDAVNTNVPGTYIVTYDTKDSSNNNATTVIRVVTVRDTTPPVISRIGAATLTVEAGSSYTDQGATATDSVDGNVSVTVGGDTVNTSVPGEYTITYNAKDAANNSAVQVTRVVTVQDTTGPVISLTGPSTLTLEAGVDSYTEQGATATDNVDSSVSVTIGGDSVDTNVPGTYIVTYNAKDSLDNAAAEVTRTVTVQDTTPPVITLIGDTSITLQAGVDSYTEQGATAVDIIDGTVNVVVGGDTVNPNVVGVYTVSYSAEDSRSNNAQITRTVNVVAPPQYSIVALNSSKLEGDSGTTELTFTVSRTGATDRSGSVNWAITNLGTHLNSSDFLATSGTLNFTADQTSQVLTIQAQGDQVVELDEQFTVELSQALPSGALINPSAKSAQGTIQNDDQASIAISAGSVTEGDSGTPKLTYSVTLTGEVDTAVSVDFATQDGGASAGDDYTAKSSSITLSSSAATTVTVDVLPDNLAETNETVTGMLSNIAAGSRNVIFTNTSALATINDDDAKPVAIADSGYEVDENRSVTVPAATGLLANDTDEDDGNGFANLTAVEIVDNPAHGVIQLQPDGGFTFTPTADYFGPDTFSYRVSDGTNTAVGNVSITINELNVADIAISSEVLQSSLVAGGEARDTFRVTVTNNGPDHATTIKLAQLLSLPSGVATVSAVPSSGTITDDTWSLDLLNGQSATVVIRLQAADSATAGADVINLSTSLASLKEVDETPENNLSAVTASIVKATEVTITSGTPTINPQTGLIEVLVTINNTNASAIDGARIYVSGYPSNTTLYNGTGIRSYGNPAVATEYLLYNTSIPAGTSVQVPVVFYRADLDTAFSPDFNVELLSTPEVIPVGVGSPAGVFRIIKRSGNAYMIELDTEPGERYRIEYSDDLINWVGVPTVVPASTNRTFWTDNGLPDTSSHPSTKSRRFYRAYKLPIEE